MIKNNHHLFTYGEVKEKLISLFGESATSEEEEKLTKKASKLWKQIPILRLDLKRHNKYHEEEKNRFCNLMGWFNNEIQKIVSKGEITEQGRMEIIGLTNKMKKRLIGTLNKGKIK